MRFLLSAALLAAVSVCCASSADAQDLREQVRKATGNLRDLSYTARVVKKNDAVLKKMGKKFVQQYEIEKADTLFKMPDNFRLEGKIGMVKVQMIMSGNLRIFRVPALRLSKREDISREGFKKQTCIDIGIFCESVWEDFDVKYIKSEQLGEVSAHVLELVRKWENPKSYRTWVDKKTLRILKIEKRDSNGQLLAIFKFPEAKLVDGVIWVPTRAELYSPDGELAAVTESYGLKANTGLSDKLFQ